ncbi:MAG: type IV pilus assembly protein PilM [Patescibacteria group bacterium]|nr:type IV pilus assembly protein PilM [Patescibacteria group bacterium]
MLKNPFDGAFGLNIGDSSIKLVQLAKKRRLGHGHYFLAKEIRTTELPVGCIANGEIQQPEVVAGKIKQLLAKQKNGKAIKNPWVVASLPVTKTFLKLINIESPPEEVTEEIVKFEAAKHLPFNISDVYLDWQIVGTDTEPRANTRVLIGAAPKNIVESYFALLSGVDLQPLALEIEDLSIARALITAHKNYQGEARAILDLGGSRSSMIIYDKGSIQFSSMINFSSNLVDTILMQKLNISREKAEELKIKNGLAYDSDFPLYLKTMMEIADKLTENVYQILLFYRDHFNSPNPITRVTMTGGLASMTNLSDMLAEKLKTETALGHAWKNLFNDEMDQEDKNGLLMAPAIGLALRAADWINTR